MLPGMTKLLRKFPYMFPDTVTVQEMGQATVTNTGAIIPPSWANKSGLTSLACLIESLIIRQLRGGEATSETGQVSVNDYVILFDRIYTGINERQRLTDQDGKVYEITEVARDDHSAATVLKAKEIKP